MASSRKLDFIIRKYREWRRNMDLTQREVMEAANAQLPPEAKPFSPSTVSNYEGRNPPSAEFLSALKAAFPDQVNLDWFLMEFSPDPAPPRSDWLSEPPDDLEFWDERDRANRWSYFFRGSGLVDVLKRLPAYDSRYEKDRRVEELLDVMESFVCSPFEHPEHFRLPNEMSPRERIVYLSSLSNALLVALRALNNVPAQGLGMRVRSSYSHMDIPWRPSERSEHNAET